MNISISLQIVFVVIMVITSLCLISYFREPRTILTRLLDCLSEGSIKNFSTSGYVGSLSISPEIKKSVTCNGEYKRPLCKSFSAVYSLTFYNIYTVIRNSFSDYYADISQMTASEDANYASFKIVDMSRCLVYFISFRRIRIKKYEASKSITYIYVSYKKIEALN